MVTDPFKEYFQESDPSKRYKAYAWDTAIGLQAVDGLETSEYLKSTALKNINGEISFTEANDLLHSYYENKPFSSEDIRTEEADKVSARIAALLSEKSFSFTPAEYLSMHRKLFSGILPHAGRIRTFNLSKKEWVLDDASVIYGTATELKRTLEYDLDQEKNFCYRLLSEEEIIHHLAEFISALWQIHVFPEGNTRTTAVFFIKYLRSLGYDVTNDIFADNAWYFRNSLVRANYNDLPHGIHATTKYLEDFLENLILKKSNVLLNRNLHIHSEILFRKKSINSKTANFGNTESMCSQDRDNKHIKVDIGTRKVDIGAQKVDIETRKVDIDSEKVDIETHNLDIPYSTGEIPRTLGDRIAEFKLSNITAAQINKLKTSLGSTDYFGRSDILDILGIKASRGSLLIQKMLKMGLIKPIAGHGKGKYKFI